MTDKKFTQEQIIKALECCSNDEIISCGDVDCPLHGYCMTDPSLLEKLALDLINQKDAEIERLQEELKITRAAVHNNGLEWGLISIKKLVDDTKTEVIERLTRRFKQIALCEKGFNINIHQKNKFKICKSYIITEKDFDNLVKEMTEVDK